MEVIIKEAGNRLDKALADLTELSRSQANEAIKAGTVLVNGKSAKAKYAVKEGDVITYELPEEEVLEYKAEDIPLDILYEDKDIIVINKPRGMVVHPAPGCGSGQQASRHGCPSISWSHIWYLGQCPNVSCQGPFVYQWCGSSRDCPPYRQGHVWSPYDC